MVMFMVIKSKNMYLPIVFLVICAAVMSILLFASDNDFPHPWLALLVFIFMTFKYCIVVLKTIQLKENTIRTRILFYAREYDLSELKTITIFKADSCLIFQTHFQKMIIFSPKKVKVPSIFDPGLWAYLFHPFSMTVINVLPKGKDKWLVNEPLVYPVTEEAFHEICDMISPYLHANN